MYSFFFDDNLAWQTTIQAFDGLPLHYGIRNSITSGPSGVTAITAVDNWNFVPEPATLDLLGLGGLWSLSLDKTSPHSVNFYKLSIVS